MPKLQRRYHLDASIIPRKNPILSRGSLRVISRDPLVKEILNLAQGIRRRDDRVLFSGASHSGADRKAHLDGNLYPTNSTRHPVTSGSLT